MARVVGLRGRALASCLRSLAAGEQGACGPLSALASTAADCAPSTSYSPEPWGWQRHWRRSSGSAASGSSSAASASAGSSPMATHMAQPSSLRAARRAQHSGPAAAAVEAPSRQAVYKVEVMTGDVRGAGSPAPAVIKLIGSEGESEPIVLGDSGAGDKGFERATKKTFTFASRDLGQLQRVHVQQLPHVSDGSGVGWFLDRVEVQGPEGAHWSFPCSAWLGKEASHTGMDWGDHERNLSPAVMRPSLQHSMRDPSYALKGPPLQPEVSAVSLPHPEKAAVGQKGMNRKGYGWGGEDAYFYCSNHNGITALGVADGVYMWKEKGIDAGMYSRRMMEFARHAVDLGTTDVLRVLQFAAKRLRLEGIQGSSTACIMLVDQIQGRLSAANVGDSGFVLIGQRRGERASAAKTGAASSRMGQMVVKYRSPQQEHGYGHPYQLGHFEGADLPEDAMLTTMPVAPGDIVVLGSDGLWDNVSEAELVEEVQRDVMEGVQPSVIAQRLAFLAFANSQDNKKITPYSEGASEAFDMVFYGGKADDITVLCAAMH